MSDLVGKWVAMVVAHEGFRDEELIIPKELLEEAGAGVWVVSTELTPAKGKLGAEIGVDRLLAELHIPEVDALVFIGGPGCRQFFHDEISHRLLHEASEKNKIIGSICSAGATLAKAGVLRGKQATSYPTEREDLLGGGAEYLDQPVVVDGRIVTANGPGAAQEFGEALIRLLSC